MIPLSVMKKCLIPSFEIDKKGSSDELPFNLKIKSSKKLSLGEYGRQRTSKKFHDLVLNLRFQNSRVPEIEFLQALFSQRKVFNLLN